VWQLVETEDDVAWHHPRTLFAFALKHDLVVGRHATLDLSDELFLLLDNLVAVAVRAVVAKHLASPSALGALLLHLHREALGHALVHEHDALATTSLTCRGLLTAL
jgi:hypothetical protein